jgi:hypothetical protein
MFTPELVDVSSSRKKPQIKSTLRFCTVDDCSDIHVYILIFFVLIFKGWELLLTSCDACGTGALTRQNRVSSHIRCRTRSYMTSDSSSGRWASPCTRRLRGHLPVLIEQAKADNETLAAELQVGVTIRAWVTRNQARPYCYCPLNQLVFVECLGSCNTMLFHMN